MSTNKLASKTLYTRTINGTTWPVEVVLYREQFGAKPSWRVTVVCNGVSEGTSSYKTKREAVERFSWHVGR